MDAYRSSPGGVGGWLAAKLGDPGRPSLVLEGVRVVAGALLVRHFIGHLRYTPRLIGAEGVWHPPLAEGAAGIVELSRRLGELSTTALHVYFGAGAVLASMVTLGLWPRWCALLLFLGTAVTYHALPPVTSPDDAFVRFVSLWLALFPVGRALTIMPARRGPSTMEPGSFVAGVATLLLALLVYVEIGTSILSLGLTPVTVVAAAAAAASLIAPGRLWRTLGVVPASFCAFQLHRAGGADVTSGVLLACHALSALGPRGPEPRRSPVDALVALAVIVLALQPLQRLASAGGLTRMSGAGAAVLSQVGLAPGAWRAADRAERDIVFERAEGHASRGAVDVGDVRMQLLVGALGVPSAPASLRLTAARGLVARHCRNEPGQTAPGEVLVGGGNGPMAVAWFDCGDGSTPPRVVLLGAPAPAPQRGSEAAPAEPR